MKNGPKLTTWQSEVNRPDQKIAPRTTRYRKHHRQLNILVDWGENPPDLALIRRLFKQFLLLNSFYSYLFGEKLQRVCEFRKSPDMQQFEFHSNRPRLLDAIEFLIRNGEIQ